MLTRRFFIVGILITVAAVAAYFIYRSGAPEITGNEVGVSKKRSEAAMGSKSPPSRQSSADEVAIPGPASAESSAMGAASPGAESEPASARKPAQVLPSGPEVSQISVNRTTYGKITENEIWRGEIRITGDIEVVSGATLIIEPGTIVKIAANSDIKNLNIFPFFDLKKGVNTTKDYDQYIHRGEPYRDEANHVSIRVKGTLQAVGTPERMITITSDSPNPGRYDWNVFNFEKGRVEYVVMEYYRAFGPGNGAVVKNSIFRHTGECAICANSSALIEYNQAFDTGHEIVDMHNSSPIVRYNRLGPSPEKSGIIIDGGSPQIIGNHIFNVRDGINFISPPENPALEGNTFENTEENIAHNY